jgi:hypothetical protein
MYEPANTISRPSTISRSNTPAGIICVRIKAKNITPSSIAAVLIKVLLPIFNPSDSISFISLCLSLILVCIFMHLILYIR